MLWNPFLIVCVLSLGLDVAAQGPVPYTVTTTPLDVGGPRSIGLCIAVRNNNVWWWQSRLGGCDSRTSSVIAVDRVMVTTTQTDKRLTFALPLIPLPGSTGPESLAITLLLHADGETLSSVGPNGVIAQVPTVERPNLDIPEQR